MNERFREKLGVHFPMLSDAQGKAALELDILTDTGMAQRTTYLVDGQGLLRRVWYGVKVDGHAVEVLSAAEEIR